MSEPDATGTAPSRAAAGNTAELRLPAEGAYVAVLRMTAVSLASRLDFTVDDIEELRMAVGEACALVLGHAEPTQPLVARFDLDTHAMRLRVSTTPAAEAAADIDQGSFGWQVLTALATDVVAERTEASATDPPVVAVTFTAASSVPD